MLSILNCSLRFLFSTYYGTTYCHFDTKCAIYPLSTYFKVLKRFCTASQELLYKNNNNYYFKNLDCDARSENI